MSQNNKKVALINAKLSRGQVIQKNLLAFKHKFINDFLSKGKGGTELGPHFLKNKFLFDNLQNLSK